MSAEDAAADAEPAEAAGTEDAPPGRLESTPATRSMQQAAGRATALISRFLTEFDAQPLTDALSPLTQRLGLSPELGSVAVETTLLFSDLEGFSSWVLDAGDDLALELLRDMGRANEPLVSAFHGRLVKRLGSGHMAAFRRPRDGLGAAVAMLEATAKIPIGEKRPQLRIGLHLGTPQRVAGDYFGTDVNVTARLAEAAAPGEILVSAPLIAGVGSDMLAGLLVQRRQGFRAKGVPADLQVYSVTNPSI